MGFFNKTDEQREGKQQEQQELFKKRLDEHLLLDEQILFAGMILNDFAFISNKRVAFVDNSLATTRKKELISIPLKAIVEVATDIDFTAGEVRVSTSHKDHTIALGKDASKQFQDTLLNLIL